ncbi:hypothetical protein [Vitreimonas sp.]
MEKQTCEPDLVELGSASVMTRGVWDPTLMESLVLQDYRDPD